MPRLTWYSHAVIEIETAGTKLLVDEGFVFENEFRSASEVMAEPAEGFEVENPAYDATPVDLLESVITDEGRQTF